MTLKGKITERSLYPHLSQFLGSLGFNSITEVAYTSNQLDILAIYNRENFIIEVKIGEKSKKLIEGLSQAMKYSKQFDTRNIIVLNYPTEIRNSSIEDIKLLTLETKINPLVITNYLNYSDDIIAKDLLFLLKSKIDQKETAISLKMIVDVISESINEITKILKKISKDDTEELFKLVTGRYDLFKALSELKNEEESRDSALNLISYLLINQILFYYIYTRRQKPEKIELTIPELKHINKLSDLSDQFELLQKIDYEPIYQVKVISKLPENSEIIEAINETIDLLTIIRPELIEHDLMGRLFHDILPFETRKILAAFYTNPIAADILTNITIHDSRDKIVDLACGSGTLLVSAYNRKKFIAKKGEWPSIHKNFVEEDLTGIDIMPFAAHISAVNLSSQSFEVKTDKLKIAVMDSLKLSNVFRTHKCYSLKDFSTEMQSTFEKYHQQQRTLGFFIDSESEGAVSLNAAGEFEICRNTFDVCLMNPPFSDREKMPNSYLQTLSTYTSLTDLCGSQVNLWGYFVAMCDWILKDNGFLSFVIPISIFRGRSSDKIKKHILSNYLIKYVIKTGKNPAFSEKAAFRDVLLIAQKVKPKNNDLVRFVIINEDLHDLNFEDARNISEYIQGKSVITSKNLDIKDYPYSTLIENKENLMPVFGVMSTKSSETFIKFNKEIKNHLSNLLRKLKTEEISEGFHVSPKGLSQMAFITNNFGENRIKKAFLILEREQKNYIKFRLKNLEDQYFKIEKSRTSPAFRTLTDVSTFDISNKLDYIITEKFENCDLILKLSNFKDRFDFDYKLIRDGMQGKETFIVLGRRFRPNSNNTSFFAFCSEIPIIAPDTFKILKMDLISAKLNTLLLNSIIGIINCILLKEQTTGAYTDIRETDLIQFDVFEINNLSQTQKDKLLKLYDELKTIEFDSLKNQFKNATPERKSLDKSLLKIFGIPDEVIESILPEVYNAVTYELEHE
jgi:hypothetical protein